VQNLYFQTLSKIIHWRRIKEIYQDCSKTSKRKI